MALNGDIHWGCILRVDVAQPIKQEGWKYLLQEANNFNFDGEIFGLGFRMEDYLRDIGFRGSEAGLEADFVDNHHRDVVAQVNWLEHVEVTPFNDDIKPFGAYKLKQSDVFTVPTMTDELLTKGYQCDWPPYIGKIK
tara:strand:+ start:1877 stop:2287 length:411 start_codon:yes stop_codon:yes gene_type:complete